MSAIKDIFVDYGPAYLDKFGDDMPANHKKVIDAIISCRTEDCGMTVYKCQSCETFHHF